MQIPKNPRITITRTCGEWDEIVSRLNLKDHKALHSYLNSKINKLKNIAENDIDEICFANGIKKEIQFRIRPEAYIALTTMAAQMRRPLNQIIEEFIICPILKPTL